MVQNDKDNLILFFKTLAPPCSTPKALVVPAAALIILWKFDVISPTSWQDHHHPLLEEPLQPPATPIPSFYIKEKPIIRFFERRELLLNYSFHTTWKSAKWPQHWKSRGLWQALSWVEGSALPVWPAQTGQGVQLSLFDSSCRGRWAQP